MNGAEGLAPPTLVAGLSTPDIEDVVRDQLAVAGLLSKPRDFAQSNDRAYYDNETLWSDIISERLSASATIKLADFSLYEWFPRSPGVFHTANAENSRLAAREFRELVPFAGQAGGTPLQPPSLRPGMQPEYMHVYNPYGKLQMLNGGVGAIRLKPKSLGSDEVWFMSASSTSTCHEGFPVAVPSPLYSGVIDQIKTAGSARCTLVGKLRFVPEPVDVVYRKTGVPQLYLFVEELLPVSGTAANSDQDPKVSVAVSFLSEYEGAPNMYWSYVTFFPGERGSLDRSVDWLEFTYVQSMYHGKITTDFDEQRSRYQHAPLSLEKVLTNQVSEQEVQSQISRLPNFYGDLHVYFDRYETTIKNSSGFNVGHGGQVHYGGDRKPT